MTNPSWFSDGEVIVSSAMTCGINKDGNVQYLVDPTNGTRSSEIDDQLYADVSALRQGKRTNTTTSIPLSKIFDSKIAVPTYYDRHLAKEFIASMAVTFPDFQYASLGELITNESVLRMKGHGSPSQDQRTGSVPYIKVSDLRAGLVNINPTNMVPFPLAEHFWRGKTSGLKPYDLISPERASKNIGDFCVLLPGQEKIVLTKEVIVLRPGPSAKFDSFYLMWALSLKVVRDQWNRVIFMQTNREDVGLRYEEILIPVPPSMSRATEVSTPFREYYLGLSSIRSSFQHYLGEGNLHHFYLGVFDESITENT